MEGWKWGVEGWRGRCGEVEGWRGGGGGVEGWGWRGGGVEAWRGGGVGVRGVEGGHESYRTELKVCKTCNTDTAKYRISIGID